MARRFTVGRLQSGGAPEIQEYFVNAAATFKEGALVVLNGAGELTECGADPALILGVAQSPPKQGPGYDTPSASKTTVTTGRENKVGVAIANRATVFRGRGVNGGTDPVTPLLTHIDETYGVAKDGNDIWVIDFSDTVNTRVKITEIDIESKSFLFKFLEANMARP